MQNLVLEQSLFECDEDMHPQSHAKYLDKKLGFKIPKIENRLLQKYRAYYKADDQSNGKRHFKDSQTWIGLHPQALQTPYHDLYQALYLLKDFNIEKIVDIGAGYGRVAFVMKSLFPKASFTGFEILKQRQLEANRLYEKFDLDDCQIHLQNVLEEGFTLPHAQVYFIYDFSELDDICQILDQLSARLGKEDFFLISRGDRTSFLLEKKYKEFWRANGFWESGELKIYSSNVKLTE